MTKNCNEIEIELTEEEIKFVNEIWNFWGKLGEEFGDNACISDEDFTDFLDDVVNECDYTVLEGKRVKIVRK